MRKGKVHLQSWVRGDIARWLDSEVEKGDYLNTSRSEVLEALLEVLVKNGVDNEKFSESLRGEIIRRRKEEK